MIDSPGNKRNSQCIRGGGSIGVVQLSIVFLFTMTAALVILATSMLLIILTFYNSECSLKRTRSMMKKHVTDCSTSIVLYCMDACMHDGIPVHDYRERGSAEYVRTVL